MPDTGTGVNRRIMNIVMYIHLPEVNISDESLKVGAGEIMRLPVEKWVSMDQYYERFETQIRRNGEPIFYYCASFKQKDHEEIIKSLPAISKQIHLSLILYTGIITALPELSISYVLFQKNKKRKEIGDAYRRSVGDAGREFIVNNYAKIILSKSEEPAINIIYDFLQAKQSTISSSSIEYFISTLRSMGISGLGTDSKITHLVSSIENLLLPDVTTNLRQNFLNSIGHIIRQIDITDKDPEALIRACYEVRSAVVHGQDTEIVFKKKNLTSDTLFQFILRVYFIILLKILDTIPNHATEKQIRNCLSDLSNKNLSFPELKPKWLKS